MVSGSKSLFECTVSDTTYERMKTRLLKLINQQEDSIRFYRMPEERERRVEEFGVGKVVDLQGASGGLMRNPMRRALWLHGPRSPWRSLKAR